nr:hypothetical protein [Tanacetum cinerariifolium]
MIDEVVEPIAKGEEQVVTIVIDVEEDIAMLFGDDDFSDDDSKGFEDDEEVVGRLEQVGTQMEQGQQATTQRDKTIEGLSQQCIPRMDRRHADLERRPSGPQ